MTSTIAAMLHPILGPPLSCWLEPGRPHATRWARERYGDLVIRSLGAPLLGVTDYLQGLEFLSQEDYQGIVSSRVARAAANATTEPLTRWSSREFS